MNAETVPPFPELSIVPEADKGTDIGVSDTTDVDIPAYVPEQLTPDEKIDVSERWETLKESLSWKDVILHPVARLSIFYHEGALKQADREYEEWKAEEKSLREALEKTDASVQKSTSVRDALRTAQEVGGIELDSKKYNEGKRMYALGKTDVYQQTRKENLEFVSAKLADIEKKRQRFEDERDLAKKVFIDSYVGKVDAEKALAAGYTAEIGVVEHERDECSQRADELGSAREVLEGFTPEELLSYDAKEIQETIQQLASKERQFVAEAELYGVQATVLQEKRTGTISKQTFWEARIAPKEALVASPEEVVTPDGAIEEQAAEGEGDVVQEVEVAPVPELPFPEAPADIPVPIGEKKEVRPKNIFDAIRGVREAGEAMEYDERADFDSVFAVAQRGYERKYPNSNMMKWLKSLFDFLLTPETQKPKKPNSKK